MGSPYPSNTAVMLLLTWHTPSLARRSKTLLVLLSGRRAALHLHWPANGHPPQRPSSGQSARNENGKSLRTSQDVLGSIPDPHGQGLPGIERREIRKDNGEGGHLANGAKDGWKATQNGSANLFPQWWLRCQAGNGCHHPAVTQTALVQVTSADTVHKQTRVLAYLLV